ncbi:ABC transporter ATP-binding protein [Maribacter sp. 2307UL18-2]|uniref:ABC transporter ATP-binding protein n=1 Tax=Maribacter sp. 2307UL18-2 TaxID=3386274 RepID=UPI0039BCD158
MKLSISNLTKTYTNGLKALNDLNLEIEAGMFGLLGPNGAGKSTLMRTIATLQNPDCGKIAFDEINILDDPMAIRRVLGYLPQSFGVYPNISAEKLLDYFAVLKGVASKKERNTIVQEVLELTNLCDVRKKSVSGYSGGMKQRFGIAQLLLNNPQLIIVDEPTAGLDPAERNRFLNVLREVGTTNTVIFSTHIVDDIKELCTDMAIMNRGRILQHGQPSTAISKIKSSIWSKTILSKDLEWHENEYQVLSSGYNQDNSISIRVFSEEIPHESFRAAQPNLEDVYFIALQKDNTK